MKAQHLERVGDFDGLTIRDVPDPEVGAGEVLVRLRAASLNRRDLMILLGYYLRPERTDLIPLSDGAGEVVAVGRGVTRFKVGDRVVGTFFADWSAGRPTATNFEALGGPHDGTLVQYRLFRPEALVPVPDHLSFEEAATLPCAAVTAWSALSGGKRPLHPGDWVLTRGTGGVSLFALRFAKSAGARVVAVTSTREKADRLRELGADGVILPSERPDWETAAREFTDGVGFDKVVDMGGAGSFARSVAATALSGHVAVVGYMDHGGAGRETIPADLLTRVFTMERVSVGDRTVFEDVIRLMAAHRERPVIDRVFPFADARDAYRRMAEGAHVGKIVIAID